MTDERDPAALALAEHLAHILNLVLSESGRMVFVWDGHNIPPAVQTSSASVQ